MTDTSILTLVAICISALKMLSVVPFLASLLVKNASLCWRAQKDILHTKSPYRTSPNPFGHILQVYGSDGLSSGPPWPVRLGPIEMAVTRYFSLQGFALFSFGRRLRLSFVTENYPVAVGWGDKSLLGHKTHTDKSVKNQNDKAAGVLFLKFGQMFRHRRSKCSGLLLRYSSEFLFYVPEP